MSAEKNKLLGKDWLLALVFSAVFFALAFSVAKGAFASLETDVYDLGVRLSHAVPSDRIAVIAIDDKSIENMAPMFGRWPWSRSIHAEFIEQLGQGGAKLVTSTIFFSEPQLDQGLAYIRDASGFLGSSLLAQNASQLPAQMAEDVDVLRQKLLTAETELNSDGRLAASISAAGNVILPTVFELGAPLGRPDGELPDYVMRSAISRIEAGPLGDVPAVPATRLAAPIAELGMVAAGLGHLNFDLDADGGVRSMPLVVDYYGRYFPSLALETAARSLNLTADDIRVTLGEKVELGNLIIATTPNLVMYNGFYSAPEGEKAFPVDSFWDVYSGQVPVDKFRNKIVLVGATAAGIGNAMRTPVDPNLAPVEVLAHIVSGILQEDFFTRPEWAWIAETAVLIIIFLYIAFFLPRLSAGAGALVSLLMLAAMLSVEVILLMNQSQWVQMTLPAAFLTVGHLVMTLKGFRLTEQQRQRSDQDSLESNKMLGLAFQGQGQLDMAFEKFRRCPMDKALMDLLYNLALDYERKRQFNKAGAVYSHMAEYNLDYKDLRQRVKRSQNLEETLVLGRSGGRGVPNLLSAEGDVQKPMLGRYEVEKEIGKGAMGVVYLGRDPKINRVVAIKTIPLSDEFEDEDLVDAKERFFREAETAGRLNHPNIVTIFDVGEEHDLAYIAMEFLKGDHLNRNTKADTLMPADKVLDIMARTADALHYAHKLNIVHRDIKPANIMYDSTSDAVKVTDFGIARITDSSKTKTGIVLGTPSYMSPEQLGGKPVDGRSDLFSLGVTLYQLLSGQLPFQADSMGSLMYKIANEAPTPLSTVRPDLPQGLNEAVNKALTKDADTRYQSGEEMANELRRCAAALQ
ncbi:MAG: CHASE2 domain-containing protein [Gammaproteobacteria bacterium]|nr:CHASE2 domain-containing protein [Gammaproteobacteria bacterium]